MIVFSIRIFSIAAIICFLLLLPLNYNGQDVHHRGIPSESVEAFSIANVKEGSKWLWAHCLSLYIISCSACVLLYFEYKSITKMRLAYIVDSSPNPSHFTVLVRSIPWAATESYSDSVKKYFTNYHASSYLSHQIVYWSGTVQKLMRCTRSSIPCVVCGGTANSFKILSSEPETPHSFRNLESASREKECSAAFVFFRSRYSALVASQVLQTSNPMLWVTELAPEPHDVYWANLCIPYSQLWIRRIATLLSVIAFVFAFIIPVAFVQGLTHLDQLKQAFPFLNGILRKPFVSQLVTGYLPSVILMLFLYTVPPMMMLFAIVKGSISRSGRKKDACCKVLYFTIWNVFFVNVFSGSVISQWNVLSSPKDIPGLLARAVPTQASLFMTYVLTSGWASLCCEVVQLFPLLCNTFYRYILRKDDPYNGTLSFPYHTEVPRVLVFGLLGFTCSILAPLILPLLLVYYFLAYLVYRNQFHQTTRHKLSKISSEFRAWPCCGAG